MAECLHPVTIRNKGKGPDLIQVPCGKCPNCLATKLNHWVFRLKQHYKDFKYASFITLTYDEFHVPYYLPVWSRDKYGIPYQKGHYIASVANDGIFPSDDNIKCLKKKDLQDFFRRLRKYHKGAKFSYYAIGEYGLDYDRPHYHMILFSNDIDVASVSFLRTLKWLWSNGFVDCVPVTEFRIQYVCKHHLKPKNSKEFPIPQFTLRSNGIGLAFLDDATAK